MFFWLTPAVASEPYAVHEWGTFTSVSAADGPVARWRPLLGPPDVPSFVYSADHPQPGLRDNERPTKTIDASVRMETPVIYFHGITTPTQVSVAVDFPSGHITEWYPRAREVPPHHIDWGTFTVHPDDGRALPDDGRASHYYPARAVAADLVQVCDNRGDEWERFLFYRGIADFTPSLDVRMRGDNLVFDPRGTAVAALVVEARDGRIGFRWTDGVGVERRPALRSDAANVQAELRRAVASAGLFEDEAAAMVATWGDHWFVDGLRVFYVLPRGEVDEVLPLRIEPAPRELVRVLVGRIEVITPEQEQAAARAVASAADDAAALADLTAAYGRFAEPILARLAPRDPRAERLLATLPAR